MLFKKRNCIYVKFKEVIDKDLIDKSCKEIKGFDNVLNFSTNKKGNRFIIEVKDSNIFDLSLLNNKLNQIGLKNFSTSN